MRPSRAFVGCMVPRELGDSSETVSQAANSYQWRAIEALAPEVVVTIWPLGAPIEGIGENPCPLIALKTGARARGRAAKAIGSVVDCLRCVAALQVRRISEVICYNLDYRNVTFVVIWTFLLRRKLVLIAADNLQGESAKTISERLFAFIAARCRGCISLSKRMRLSGRQVISPGIQPIGNQLPELRRDCRRVLYCGSLGSTTGLAVVAKAAVLAPEFEFTVTGKPFRCSYKHIASVLQSAKSRGAKIRFHGLLSRDEFNRAKATCGIGLSLRNPGDAEHGFNFPSKILEMLANGQSVISTIAYPEIPEGLLWLCKFSAEDLVRALRDVDASAQSERVRRAMDARKFLEAECSPRAFAEKCESLFR